MNKELLDKVTQALDSQQRAIEIHEQTIRQKDKDIRDLKELLELSQKSQTQRLQQLPSLLESLKSSIALLSEQLELLKKKHSEQTRNQSELGDSLIALAEIQLKLVQSMKDYQNELELFETSETKLSDLQTSQEAIVKALEGLRKRHDSMTELSNTLQSI